MTLDETVKRLRALLAGSDLYERDRADAEEVLDAADLLCAMRAVVDDLDVRAQYRVPYWDVLEAAERRREQARERGGSDGK